MESFDYRKYVPLGLIAFVLLLPILLWMFSGGDGEQPATERPSSSRDGQSDRGEPDTTTPPDRPRSNTGSESSEPGESNGATDDHRQRNFPPPPYEIAHLQTPPGYEQSPAELDAAGHPREHQPSGERLAPADQPTTQEPTDQDPTPQEPTAQEPAPQEATSGDPQVAGDTPSSSDPQDETSSQDTPSQDAPSGGTPAVAERTPVDRDAYKQAIGTLRSELIERIESNREELKEAIDQTTEQLAATIRGQRLADREKLKHSVHEAVEHSVHEAVEKLGDSLRADLKSELHHTIDAETQAIRRRLEAALRELREAEETTRGEGESNREESPLSGDAENLPIDLSALRGAQEVKYYAIGNMISLAQLNASINSGAKGLELDLKSVTRLLDGTEIDPKNLYGNVYLGPYPFEAAETDFRYKRFRPVTSIQGGRATLDVGRLLRARYNSEEWTDRGTITLRVVLFLQSPDRDRSLGAYDTFTAFVKTDGGYQRQPWIVEGPSVHLLNSDDPTRATIRFATDEEVPAVVLLGDGREITTPAGREHVVPITQLEPGGKLQYRIRVGQITSKAYSLQAAPARGEGPVTFAYCGDSRAGVGTGEQAMMGVNYQTLQLHAARAYKRGARFFLFGGDLINGYTTSPADFRTQIAAWKQATSGFSAERPLYPVMGNHESLLHVFKMPSGGQMVIDRWPYDTESAEAVFADEFINPTNGPRPSDPRRPPYAESVYTFQFGMVRVLAMNNNYWYSNNPKVAGGSPEGYIFDDQLRWIEHWLDDAERDPTVKYVVLYAQEPVFPCGGHASDAMWYDGDNKVRPFTYTDGKLQPAAQGMLDVRNRLARAVGRSSKVAAVLCSDEHSYYRVLIDREVPVGDPRRDDRNGDGEIEWQGGEPASPLVDLKRPVWYLTSGGGGAPYYAEEQTPWTNYWWSQEKSGRDPRDGFYYSSQENLILFHATEERISVEVVNPYGERIDWIGDLMP